MSRYIDADKAKEKLGVVRGAYSCFLEEDRPYYDVLSETIKMINEMSTADVRKNIHAKKVIGGGEHDGATCWFECSHCHGTVDILDAYCKHCGAVLELGNDL
jgi:hypothetical protein